MKELNSKWFGFGFSSSLIAMSNTDLTLSIFKSGGLP